MASGPKYPCPRCNSARTSLEADCAACEWSPDASRSESTAPDPLAPDSRIVGHTALPLVALFIVAIALIVFLAFPMNLGMGLVFGWSVIVVTSVVMYVDSKLLQKQVPHDQSMIAAGSLLAGMLLLWIVFFPMAFFQRRKITRPDMAIPGLGLAMAYFLLPILVAVFQAWNSGIVLPMCDSAEVRSLVETLVRDNTSGLIFDRIDGFEETGRTTEPETATGRCVAHSGGSASTLFFVVEWQDRNRRMFQVRLLPPELPGCDSVEVRQLLAELLAQAGISLAQISKCSEVRFDGASQYRVGECTVEVEGESSVVRFSVEWVNEDRAGFKVEILGISSETNDEEPSAGNGG